MAGTAIRIGASDFIYFAAGEILSAADESAEGFDFVEDAVLRENLRLRRVLVHLLPGRPQMYGVLHWSDGSDLKYLDGKVWDGSATEDDFSGALLADLRSITCRFCESQFRVLAALTASPLFFGTLAERLRSHEKKRICPVCRSELNANIVELILFRAASMRLIGKHSAQSHRVISYSAS
jgi:hypothetical protein